MTHASLSCLSESACILLIKPQHWPWLNGEGWEGVAGGWAERERKKTLKIQRMWNGWEDAYGRDKKEKQLWISYKADTSWRKIIPNAQHSDTNELQPLTPIPASRRWWNRDSGGGGISQNSPSIVYWKTVRERLCTEISYWSPLSLKPMVLSQHTCSFSHGLFSRHSTLYLKNLPNSASLCFHFLGRGSF